MPLMIEEGPIQVHETRPPGPAADVVTPDPDAEQQDGDCSCDSCRSPARDEMWTRWA